MSLRQRTRNLSAFDDPWDDDSTILSRDRPVPQETKSGKFPVLATVLGVAVVGISAVAVVALLTSKPKPKKTAVPKVVVVNPEASDFKGSSSKSSFGDADTQNEIEKAIRNAPWFKRMVADAPRIPTAEEVVTQNLGNNYLISPTIQTLPSTLIGSAGGFGDMMNASDVVSPIKDQPRINYDLVKLSLCPAPFYNTDSIGNSDVHLCTEACPRGFDTVWFEMKDNNFKSYAKERPKVDEDGNPVLGPDGKQIMEKIVQRPQPWCRATCPPKLESPTEGNWAQLNMKPSSAFLSGDAKIVKSKVGGVVQRTDAGLGEASAYCANTTLLRTIHRGGENFSCGWCTEKVGVKASETGTSTTRHNCDIDGDHYGIDFTKWCMRRRLIPNFMEETLGNSKARGNLTKTAICASVNGVVGRPKWSKWVASPKACMTGELLPILATGYVRGRTQGANHIVDKMRSTEGDESVLITSNARTLEGDEVVFDGDGRTWSAFLEACYDRCPTWMVPYGAMEVHRCREPCPPNTFVAMGSGVGQCKKQAFLKKVFIADLEDAAKKVVAEWVIHKTMGTP